MKPIKMFGLAVLTALMAMAFVGASSAMAAESTSLCNLDPLMLEGEAHLASCPEGNQITHVHEKSVGKATLLSSSNVECNVTFLGETVESLSQPLVIKGTFSYTNCGSCTVTEENGPAEIKVLKTGHETASVTGEALVHVNCFGFINCYYNGKGLQGTAKGPLLSAQVPDYGEVSLQKQVVEFEKGSFCPEGASLDIVTTPVLNAVYIGT